MDMDIVKNIKDLSLNEDEQFFADIIQEEFGCNTYIEKISNVEFIQYNAQRVNDFNEYTTAHSGIEGARMIGWQRK